MQIYRFMSFLCASLLVLPLHAATISGLSSDNLEINATILGTLDEGRSSGDFALQWNEVRRASTPGGDSVIAGYFYASSNDVSWGSEFNPEVYVKIWFSQYGDLNLNFFHVGLFDIQISSQLNGELALQTEGGRSDNQNLISIQQADWRYLRHDYRWNTNSTDSNTASSSNPEPEPLAGITAAHNEVRRALGIADLSWSTEIAAYAQEWADYLVANYGNQAFCGMQHRTAGAYGENLAAGGGGLTAASVVNLWANEAQNYNYSNNSCNGVCGHYTQVIWSKTTELGCGMAQCAGGEVWVCNYNPPGNYSGQRPY